jgi:uncharacterized BrkB/YihY/UPF0761 family membrane protein
VFGQLQNALNTIWGVKAKPGAGTWGFIRSRFLSFALLAGIGFLLLVLLVIEAVIKVFSHCLQSMLPGALTLIIPIYIAFDFAVITVVFAMIFEFCPPDIAPTNRGIECMGNGSPHQQFVLTFERCKKACQLWLGSPSICL